MTLMTTTVLGLLCVAWLPVCVTLEGGECGDPRAVLQVLWLAPREAVTLDRRPAFSASSSVGALALALNIVRYNHLLGGRTVNVTWLDSACDPQLTLGRVVKYIEHSAPCVVIGPPCTDAMISVADVAAFYDTPLFGWVSNEHQLDNKTRASTLIRTLPPQSSIGSLALSLCQAMGWELLAIMSTEDKMSQGVADFLADEIQKSDDFNLVRHYSTLELSLSAKGLRSRMALLKQEVRVIFLIIPDSLVRDYLLAAHDEGMTSGDFQFLCIRQTLTTQEFQDSLLNGTIWRRDDGRDSAAKQAYKNLLYFTFSFILELSRISLEKLRKSMIIFENNTSMPPFEKSDLYSGFLFDAFYLYSHAYNETMTRNLTPDGRNIFHAAQSIELYGLTGTVSISNNGDRLPSFLVWDMAPNGTFRIAYNVTSAKNSTGHTVTMSVSVYPGIYWGDGRTELVDNYIPPDRPACGFSNEFCPEDNTLEIVLPVALSSVMLAGILVFFIMYRWWKREKELYRQNWRVKWKDLSFETPRNPPATSRNPGSHSTVSGASERSTSAGQLSGISSLVSREGGVLAPPHCRTARLGSCRVAVRMVRKKSIRSDRDTLNELRIMSSLKHSNLATFHGLCVEPPNLCVLWEYCSKGSLQDVFQACRMSDYRLDTMFQFSMALDLCTGLNYLHNSELKVHGNLRSSNCLVDSHWTCKLSGFGLTSVLKGERPPSVLDEQAKFATLLWTAPELVRKILQEEKHLPTQAGDIYSTAIVLKEILCKNTAYEEEIHAKGMTPKEVVSRVAATPGETLFRPTLVELPEEAPGAVIHFVHLVHACWQEDPALRPTARKLLRHLRKLNPFQTNSIMDNMVNMMERYSSRLEELVAERTSQLEEEKRRTDALLYRMLPRKVADDLKSGQHVQAEAFTSVTVYFSDIVGFTQIASESTPMQIVELLNSLYTVFDDAIQNFDVYKVETIGDAYMVVSGIPVPNGTRHVTIMADMALCLRQAVLDFTIPHMPQTQLRIRIGLNTGPVVAGVVGNIMPRYCLFGDTVNLASRMESLGVPLRIHLSPYTFCFLKDNPDYLVTERGEIDVKGKGKMRTYFLDGKQDSNPPTHEKSTAGEDSFVENASTVGLHNFDEGALLPDTRAASARDQRL